MQEHEAERAPQRARRNLLLSTALFFVSGFPLVAATAAPGRYSDGEFTGQSVSTLWGTVQVKAIVHDGALTDVQILQYPSHRRRSEEISTWALPILKTEAIRAQSAKVDIVSQASITAEGFEQSLASALRQATK
jgi:uncharacterized protein with FMN-binding domain